MFDMTVDAGSDFRPDGWGFAILERAIQHENQQLCPLAVVSIYSCPNCAKPDG